MVVEEAAAVGRLLILEDEALEVVTVELDEAEVVKTAAEPAEPAEPAEALVLVPVESV